MALQIIEDYLAQKEQEYKAFNPQRFKDIFSILQTRITQTLGKPSPSFIHIVGTNGKGSTGRFLALMLLAAQKSVGHFTSPHLLSFCDRFWINGGIVSAGKLLEVHNILLSFKDEENKPYIDRVSYFEYATLLAYMLFYHLEYAIMESGLGGEFDSTNSLPHQLSLITPIAFDHQRILGNSIECIAATKLRSITHQAIIGYQPFLHIIQQVIKQLTETKNIIVEFIDSKEFILSAQEQEYSNKNNLAAYQVQNFTLAKKAAQKLCIDYNMNNLLPFDLPARCQKWKDNVFIDVGHNTHAANAIYEIFKGQKIDLIYNSYKDKDFVEILHIFKPILSTIHILKLPNNDRIISLEKIVQAIKSLKISYDFNIFPLKQQVIYVVFGSFSVAESFILQYKDFYAK